MSHRLNKLDLLEHLHNHSKALPIPANAKHILKAIASQWNPEQWPGGNIQFAQSQIMTATGMGRDAVGKGVKVLQKMGLISYTVKRGSYMKLEIDHIKAHRIGYPAPTVKSTEVPY